MNEPSLQDLTEDYVAGRLSGEQADKFEAMLLSDASLATEVEMELKIRAALQKAERPVRRNLRPVWALAASVAVLAVGLSWLGLRSPPEPVFRGEEQRMGLKVEFAGATLNAHWASSAGASGYELQIYAADGRLVHSVEVATPTATVELSGQDKAGAAATPAFVEVVALDEFGQTLMRSQRVSLTDAPNR